MRPRSINHNALVSLIALMLLAIILAFTVSCEGTENVPTAPADTVLPVGEPAGPDAVFCSVMSEPSEDTDECLIHELNVAGAYAEEIRYMAKTGWGEARGCTPMEQAGVYWCILNRVDSDDPFYPNTIVGVITQEDQFHGYDPDHPVTEELEALAVDVLERWLSEKQGFTDVGRVLPAEYLWFHGDGKHNHFRDAYRGEYNTWDWSLPNPYEEVRQ